MVLIMDCQAALHERAKAEIVSLFNSSSGFITVKALDLR